MTNKIIISFIFFSFLFVSCSQVKEEIYEISEGKPLILESIYNIQDRSFNDMIILDSLLIFISSKDLNYFHVYDKNNLRPVISFGKKGNAGFEFSHLPFFTKRTYNGEGFFEVFDILSTKRVNLKNIIDGSSIVNEVISERLNDKITYSRNIVSLDSSIFVGTSLNESKGLFYIYDKENKKKRWVPYNPKINKNKDYYDSIYYGDIEVSPDNQTIVYCPRYFDRVLFFNKNAELIKQLNFTNVKVPKTSKEYFGVTNNETIYSYQTYRTNDFIYVLRPLHSLNDLINELSPIKIQILKLSWDGEVNEVFEHSLKLMPTLFCVDEEKNRIIFNTPIDDGTPENNISEIFIYKF